MMRPLFPREGRLHFETHRCCVRLTCGCERVFLADIHVVIDIDSDPSALEGLTDDGLQRFNCPRCDQVFDLAEPILVHDRGRGRTALFVPSAIGHRALVFHAELAAEIATADPSIIPTHAFQPTLLVGVQSLREWLFGPGARSRVPRADKNEPLAADRAAPGQDGPVRHPASLAVQSRPGRPPIHEAFADLAHADSQPPSTAPAAPEIDDVDEDEPMFADDWLARDSLSPAVPKPSPPAPGGTEAAGSTPPPPGRADATVDFTGLLDDVDDDGDIEEEDFEEEELVEEEAGDDPRFDADILAVDDDETDDAAKRPATTNLEASDEPAVEAVRDVPGPILEGA
ncbi:MAG TPA: CpXC domain-containing protein, partial [Polyangia bacterium]|nr:CpXC domain-containing protein [Polyangia bacterium]